MSRWSAIESTYERALTAEVEMPSVPLKDVFEVTVRNKDGVAKDLIARRVYCRRDQFPSIHENLQRAHPSDKFTIGVIPSCKPYSPRKGEPSYQQWKSGQLTARAARHQQP